MNELTPELEEAIRKLFFPTVSVVFTGFGQLCVSLENGTQLTFPKLEQLSQLVGTSVIYMENGEIEELEWPEVRTDPREEKTWNPMKPALLICEPSR